MSSWVFPTKTMTIGGKGLGQKRAGGRAIAITTGSYKLHIWYRERSYNGPVLAVLFVGSWRQILLNVVTLDLSWSQISLETFQTIEWCRNHKYRQPETILSYCESIVYGWRCLGFYTWKQKLFRTFKHSDIPGSQLLSDIQTFFMNYCY